MHSRHSRVAGWLALAMASSTAAATAETNGPAIVDGITYASGPNTLLAPLREVGPTLGLWVHAHEDGRITVAGHEIDRDGPTLPDGTRLVPLRALSRWEVSVEWDPSTESAILRRRGRKIKIRRGEKRVKIDKSKQELHAIQGSRTIMRTQVSTGRRGKRTPNGNFKAGPYKARMHISSLYNDSPMPFSVQITGDIFVHGYRSVPSVPASHGCIRLSLEPKGPSPARFFYEWVEVGTPVVIGGKWSG